MTMAHNQFIRKLWISSGIILTSVVVLVGAIAYCINDLSVQAGAIVDDRASIQSRADAVADLAGLEAAMPAVGEYRSAINQLLPDQYGLVTFGSWFSRIGSQYGVTANATFQNSFVPAAGTSAGTAGFSFDAEGSPANIISFLDEIDTKSSGFLLAVTSFNFTSDGTNAKVTGQGTVFFQ